MEEKSIKKINMMCNFDFEPPSEIMSMCQLSQRLILKNILYTTRKTLKLRLQGMIGLSSTAEIYKS